MADERQSLVVLAMAAVGVAAIPFVVADAIRAPRRTRLTSFLRRH